MAVQNMKYYEEDFFDCTYEFLRYKYNDVLEKFFKQYNEGFCLVEEECKRKLETSKNSDYKKIIDSYNVNIQPEEFWKIRNQDKNKSSIFTSVNLIRLFSDIKAFSFLGINKYDLLEEYDINPSILYNMNEPNIVKNIVNDKGYFNKGIHNFCYESFCKDVLLCINNIIDNELFGRQSEQKLHF